MRSLSPRLILPALLLTWALAHTALCGGEKAGKAGGKRTEGQPSIAQVREALDRPITLDFSGQSLMEALQHLRQKTNVEINLDQTALASVNMNVNENGEQPTTMKSAGGKLSTALRKLLSPHQLTYVIFEDSILITTPELAANRLMKQRVNVNVDDVPFAKTARALARSYVFNLVIDPKVRTAAEQPVSLTLEGTSLETAVRLLAELAGLKAVRMDNVMFVTTEERAAKLRKEEKDMQPSLPDDANMMLAPRGGLALPANLAGLIGPAFRPVPLPPKDGAGK